MLKPTSTKSQRLVSAYTDLSTRFGLTHSGNDAFKRARLMYFLTLADAGSRLPIRDLVDLVAGQFEVWLGQQQAAE